jgi:hypothetical protein
VGNRDPRDTNCDGEVDFCEWLGGLFGCVPPPWIPWLLTSGVDPKSLYDTTDPLRLTTVLNNEVERACTSWNLRIARARTPIELWLLGA